MRLPLLPRFLALLLAASAVPTAPVAASGAPALRWSAPEYAGSFTDPELDEVSGLAASRSRPGYYWAHNDSGNPARLMLVGPDGSRVASVDVVGAGNTDWEDMDSFSLDGRNYLLVADTGDNGGIRESVSLLVFEEPADPKDGDRVKLAWRVDFRWPDGARDCEASVVDAAHGEVLLISKKRVPPEIYHVPLRPGPGLQTATVLGKLAGVDQPSERDLARNPVYGRYRSQISGADLSPDGRWLAVLNYHSVYLYRRDPGQGWAQAVARTPSTLRFPWLPQAEAIAFSLDGTALTIGSEQRPSPLIRYRVIP